MAQEMYKHDALLHLVWAIAQADEPEENVWVGKISDEEYDFFRKIRRDEGIEINFSDFIDKRSNLQRKYGNDSVVQEALKATNGCGRKWRVKVYGYMWRMAMNSWEGERYSDGTRDTITDAEMVIIEKARNYFKITEEEDDECLDLSRM